MLHYKIGSYEAVAHYFDIVLTIPQPDPDGQVLRLPAWIPGSYMIRDFAKNIVDIKAQSKNKPLALTQLDKSSWRLEPCKSEVKVSYRVYAWDLSVRSAHLDTTHGFFNGSSVFLEVIGQSQDSCEVEICRPTHDAARHWRLATTLCYKNPKLQHEFCFGEFIADDYLDLIDHPVEMGTFTQMDFNACGVRHDVVLTGKFNLDQKRLQQDLVKICEQHIHLFGEPAPMTHYMFLVMVVGDGYGGLEHRSSTSLLCSRKDLPQPGQSKASEEYKNFLGLCSHEYFHNWNVKRIKPAVFDLPDLSSEVYTPLLWAFEGITSYYDDLAVLRSGCITRSDYLQQLGQTITRVQRGAGRKVQSAAASSFNAWTKFYKQDENAANAIVSYYAKGTLIALCIDLKIRHLTQGSKSLDHVMQQLWQNYLQTKTGITDFEIQNLISGLAGEDLSVFLHSLIYQTDALPLTELLAAVSIQLKYRKSAGQQDKGGKEAESLPSSSTGVVVKEESAGLLVQSIKHNSAAQKAGLSAGDVIIAINELRADMKYYQDWLQLSIPESEHTIHAFRRDELMQFDVVLDEPLEDTAVLTIINEDDAALAAWLNTNTGN